MRYIFRMLSKRQEAELVTAIQGRGEIPLKFIYMGEGASNWDKLAMQRIKGGGINSVEGQLLAKRVDDFVSTLMPDTEINIIDIGCGNGYPVFPLLQYLTERKRKFVYVPLDISKELLDLATTNVQKEFPDTERKSFQLDFELGQFSDIMYDLKKNDSVNLMLFLGSTLGNHSDLSRVLTNFRDSMTSKDFMIVGVELTNLARVQSILSHYEGEVYINTISFVLDHFAVPRDNYTHEVVWNDIAHQVETRAAFKKDTPIEIGGERFVLKQGEKILLMRSKKFTEPGVMSLLSDVGFRTELLTTNAERGYLLTMVQPTRYSV